MRSLCLRPILLVFLLSVLSVAQQAAPSNPAPAPGSSADLLQQAKKLSQVGKQDEALALYRQVLGKDPNSYDAHLGAGMALDLKGDYAHAREDLAKAIELAPADSKAQALRAMAFSYAFESNAGKAAEFEKQVFDARLAKNDWIGVAEIYNELARIYLESGDPDQADHWYKLGYDTAGRKTDLSDADKNLWLFRWENAQARIAARRGKADEAQQHVKAAKSALDKANNPDQARFYPYLTGYVAFYAGDYKTAIEELQKADQHDPLILALLGEACEKSGNAMLAKDFYRKVLEINTHNPTNAFARPRAKKALAGGV
jgi:tetratricopeptide (TPR) repeat protein